MNRKDKQWLRKPISYHLHNYYYIKCIRVYYYIKSLFTIILERESRKGNESEKRCIMRQVATKNGMVNSSRNMNYYVCVLISVCIYGWLSKQQLFPTEMIRFTESVDPVCVYTECYWTLVWMHKHYTGGSWKDISSNCQNMDAFFHIKQLKQTMCI